MIYSEFVVLFWVPDGKEPGAIHASVSRATPGLRYRFTKEGIDFDEMRREGRVKPGDDERERKATREGERREEEQNARLSSTDVNPNTEYKDVKNKKTHEETVPVPLLLEASSSVRNLFRFLVQDYNAPFMADVPLLYSMQAFVNGALQRLKVETVANRVSKDGVSVLSIEGIILPSAFKTISRSLRALQGEHMAWWSAMPNSEKLNIAASELMQAPPESSTLSAHEQWQRSIRGDSLPSDLETGDGNGGGCCVLVNKVRCERGAMHATVAATAAAHVARDCA